MKKSIRKILQFLHLDLTKNLAYDRMTGRVLKKILRPDSNCIDVGAHKGEVLEKIIDLAPQGKHFAIEPIPHLYRVLVKNFSDQATIFNQAISDRNGTTSFQHVRNAEAYSGIKPRAYAVDIPDINVMTVETATLDSLIPDVAIELIKIDVEGGEYEVLLGAKKILTQSRPTLIFECGKGGIDHYGHSSRDVYRYFEELNYAVYTLGDWLKSGAALKQQEFSNHYNQGSEYYFIARPRP